MKRLALLLMLSSLATSAFTVDNQTDEEITVRDIEHFFIHYHDNIPPTESSQCPDNKWYCRGKIDFRVTHFGYPPFGEPTNYPIEITDCQWFGDIGDGTGHFVITKIAGKEPHTSGWCKIEYTNISNADES